MKRNSFTITLFLAACLVQGGSGFAQGPSSAFTTANKKVTVYTTDSTSYKLSQTATLSFDPAVQPLETQPSIFVDPSHSFQTFLGMGGALTDAAAETFAKLPAAKQQEILDAYYSTDKGLGYTFARTNINSCDFSSDTYTYVKDGDKTLASFNLAHDEKFKIPLIKKAMQASGNKIKLFVSPWSPPAWMKTNNDMLHGGKLKEDFADAWANYYVKFIKAYEAKGIPIWGLTVQNEPMATQTWESCVYTAEDERNFIKNHLGPTLLKSGLQSKKLIAWDHNRDLLYERASTILNDPATAKYVWGIGFHWYEVWNGGHQYENVKRVKESFPDKNLMLTEACLYPFNWQNLNQWKWGETYGENILHDLNNGAVAWTDWNILLDETGGPNHVGNFCFAPVHAKTSDGSLHYMNSYYYIGHFSKFIRPNAKRIISSSNRAQLQTTAFQNEDGSLAVVVLNETPQRFAYKLFIGNQAVDATSLPHSISTLVIK